MTSYSQLAAMPVGAILRTMGKIKNPKDLIMLLLYAAGTGGKLAEPIQGQTRLMKMVFLFQNELSKQFNLGDVIEPSAFPQFMAFDYGPYSAQVYGDLEFLVNLQFVRVVENGQVEVTEEEKREFDYWSATVKADSDLNARNVGRAFELTDRGRRFVEAKLWPNFNAAQQTAMNEFKLRCVSTTLRSLLRYVYTRYDKMTTKSLIKNEILQ